MNLPLEMFIYIKPSISGSSGLRIRGVGRGGHRGHVPPPKKKLFQRTKSVPFCDEKCIFSTSHRYLIYCTLDSASLLVKLKPRIFQRLPPFE